MDTVLLDFRVFGKLTVNVTTILHSLQFTYPVPSGIHNPYNECVFEESLIISIFQSLKSGLSLQVLANKCGRKDSVPDQSLSLIRHCRLLFSHLDLLDHREKMPRLIC